MDYIRVLENQKNLSLFMKFLFYKELISVDFNNLIIYLAI